LDLVPGRDYSPATLRKKLGITRTPHALRWCDCCGEVSVIELNSSGKTVVTKIVKQNGEVKFSASSPESGLLVEIADSLVDVQPGASW
jgi:hypothetical protein